MPLRVTVANPKASVSDLHDDPVLFTGDGASNTLTVTIASRDTPFPLSQGDAASYATVSIFFGSLLDPGQAAGLHVDTPQWDSHWDAAGKCWQLTPNTPGLSLDAGTSLTITITGWPAFPTATHGKLTVQWSHFGDAHGALPFPVMVLRPTGPGHRLGDDVTLTLAKPNRVTVGDADTTLTLRLTNTKPEPLVASGAAANPQFTLLLACLDEAAGQTLTTRSQALRAQIAPRAPYAKLWKYGPVDDQGDQVSWPLFPQTPHVLDASAAVDFELSPLKIPRPAGQGMLYLMYTDVPGYDDGFLPLLIKKRPPVFAVKPPRFSAASLGAAETVTVSWRTSGAVASTLGLRGSPTPPISLDISADGTVACDLCSNDGTTLTVSQAGQQKGALALPADAANQLNVTLQIAARDAAGKVLPAPSADLRLDAPSFPRLDFALTRVDDGAGVANFLTSEWMVAHACDVMVLWSRGGPGLPANPVFHFTPADDDRLDPELSGDPTGHIPPRGWSPTSMSQWQTNMGTVASMTVTLTAKGFGTTTKVVPLTLEHVG